MNSYCFVDVRKWAMYTIVMMISQGPPAISEIFLARKFQNFYTISHAQKFNTYTARPVCWREWISDSYCSLKPLCSGHGGSSAGSYLADPTSSIPSHCAVIILFQSVAVHQLS